MTEPGASDSGAEGEPQRIEHEVERVRDELGELVDELDRRRQRLMDWRSQLRQHAPALVIAGALVAVALGGGLAWRARQRRLQSSPWVRLRNLGTAAREFSRNPHRAAPQQPAATSWTAPVAGALGSAAVAVARAAAVRAVQSRMRQ